MRILLSTLIHSALMFYVYNIAAEKYYMTCVTKFNVHSINDSRLVSVFKVQCPSCAGFTRAYFRDRNAPVRKPENRISTINNNN